MRAGNKPDPVRDQSALFLNTRGSEGSRPAYFFAFHLDRPEKNSSGMRIFGQARLDSLCRRH